jgi:hypothetical protein
MFSRQNYGDNRYLERKCSYLLRSTDYMAGRNFQCQIPLNCGQKTYTIRSALIIGDKLESRKQII